MNTIAIAMLAGANLVAAYGTNGYSRGIAPSTQNCNSYPLVADGNGDTAAQNFPWGLVVDREFGNCRCADEDEMEFSPDPVDYKDNTWACRCLNSDLYVSMPEKQYECVDIGGARDAVTSTAGGPGTTTCGTSFLTRVNDKNGKKCGVTAGCKTHAVTQQR